ncbi:hypothetical protein HDU85_005718 [Gaertneriomyces sp. JEL0708]|nr:hypothetical protein HDU85_005718 [Gaertneriomyces sp. JEL0708]
MQHTSSRSTTSPFGISIPTTTLHRLTSARHLVQKELRLLQSLGVDVATLSPRDVRRALDRVLVPKTNPKRGQDGAGEKGANSKATEPKLDVSHSAEGGVSTDIGEAQNRDNGEGRKEEESKQVEKRMDDNEVQDDTQGNQMLSVSQSVDVDIVTTPPPRRIQTETQTSPPSDPLIGAPRQHTEIVYPRQLALQSQSIETQTPLGQKLMFEPTQRLRTEPRQHTQIIYPRQLAISQAVETPISLQASNERHQKQVEKVLYASETGNARPKGGECADQKGGVPKAPFKTGLPTPAARTPTQATHRAKPSSLSTPKPQPKNDATTATIARPKANEQADAIQSLVQEMHTIRTLLSRASVSQSQQRASQSSEPGKAEGSNTPSHIRKQEKENHPIPLDAGSSGRVHPVSSGIGKKKRVQVHNPTPDTPTTKTGLHPTLHRVRQTQMSYQRLKESDERLQRVWSKMCGRAVEDTRTAGKSKMKGKGKGKEVKGIRQKQVQRDGRERVSRERGEKERESVNPNPNPNLKPTPKSKLKAMAEGDVGRSWMVPLTDTSETPVRNQQIKRQPHPEQEQKPPLQRDPIHSHPLPTITPFPTVPPRPTTDNPHAPKPLNLPPHIHRLILTDISTRKQNPINKLTHSKTHPDKTSTPDPRQPIVVEPYVATWAAAEIVEEVVEDVWKDVREWVEEWVEELCRVECGI